MAPIEAQSWDARFLNAPDKGQWDWAQGPWDGNDQPFVALRTQIDHAITKGQKPEVLMRRYKAAALKKRRDAKAQFAYGYSAYRASEAVRYDDNKSSMFLSYVPRDLGLPVFPRSYQYARLEFLVQTKIPSDKRLRWAGERLVQRNPKDKAVKQGLVKVLIYTTLLKQPEKTQALSLINELLHDDSKDLTALSAQGFLYYLTSKKSRDPAEVQKAIDGYRAYLTYAPKNQDFRPLAESFLVELEQRKKEFRSNRIKAKDKKET